jgi:TATA-binding protein-associated factor Taf7
MQYNHVILKYIFKVAYNTPFSRGLALDLSITSNFQDLHTPLDFEVGVVEEAVEEEEEAEEQATEEEEAEEEAEEQASEEDEDGEEGSEEEGNRAKRRKAQENSFFCHFLSFSDKKPS